MKNFTVQPEHLSNLVLGDFNDIFRREINALLLDSDTGLSNVIDPASELMTQGLHIGSLREGIRLVLNKRKSEEDVFTELYTTFDTAADSKMTDAFEYCLKVQRAIAALLVR